MDEKGILITLSQPGEAAKPLMEIDIPTDYNETASLKYEEERIRGNWGKTSIKKWWMAGFCMLYEDLETAEGNGPELTISGSHISIVCYNNSINENAREEAYRIEPWAGIVNIRNADSLILPAPVNENKRLSIIFSRPFLTRLLQSESWFKKHAMADLLHTDAEKRYQYFPELPIRHILDSLIHEDFKPLEKRYYFELKLKELFFMLHLQPEICYPESPIPSEIQRKLIAAKSYLLTNYHTAPTIKQLSRIVSLNEFKLKRYFKMMFGITIKSYVIELRMEEARNLLWNLHSVNYVTARLGYKNVSHFILLFKRTFGVTPGQMTNRQE